MPRRARPTAGTLRIGLAPAASFEHVGGIVDTPESSADFQTLRRPARKLYQVTFSNQSMEMLNSLRMEDQLRLADLLSNLSPDHLAHGQHGIQRFRRRGKDFYRVRAGDLRCYFEISGNTLFSHYILPENSAVDLAFRNGLPITDKAVAESSRRTQRPAE